MRMYKKMYNIVKLLYAIKISCTIGVLFTLSLVLVPFSIVSIPLCCFAAYEEHLLLLCRVTIGIVTLLWFSNTIMLLLGKKFSWAKDCFLILMTISTFIDFIAAVLLNSVRLRISGTLFSLLAIIICIYCLLLRFQTAKHLV